MMVESGPPATDLKQGFRVEGPNLERRETRATSGSLIESSISPINTPCASRESANHTGPISTSYAFTPPGSQLSRDFDVFEEKS